MTNYCGLPPKWDKEKMRKGKMKRHYLQIKRLKVMKDDWDVTYLKPKDKKNEKPVSKEEWDKGLDSIINQELNAIYSLMTEEEKEECRKISCSLRRETND